MRELYISEVGAVSGGETHGGTTNPGLCTGAAVNGFGVGATIGAGIFAWGGALGAAFGGLLGGLFLGATAISNNTDCGTRSSGGYSGAGIGNSVSSGSTGSSHFG